MNTLLNKNLLLPSKVAESSTKPKGVMLPGPFSTRITLKPNIDGFITAKQGPHRLNQKGQSLIEYLIIVALVAVATIGMVKVVGYNISTHFANISKALAGDSNDLSPHKVKSEDVNVRNLGDYMKGAATGISK